MEVKEKALAYVARQMGISRAKAAEITGLANEAVTEVLNGELPEETPELMAVLEQQENLIDLVRIAERLHIKRDEMSSWIEDEMVWILYGQNIAEGMAAEGPTALTATANFYCRWYNDIIQNCSGVLLSDQKCHYYDEHGEVGAS